MILKVILESRFSTIHVIRSVLIFELKTQSAPGHSLV